MGNLLMMEKLVQAFLESEQRGMASQTPLFSLPSQIPCDKSDNATKTCEVGIQTDILSPYVLASGENTTGCFDIHTPSRGVARIFQRGGGGGSQRLLTRCSPSCISGHSRIIAT